MCVCVCVCALRFLIVLAVFVGSSLQNCVKVNVFLTDMANFAAVNKVYEEFMGDPKPVGLSFFSWSLWNYFLLQ